MKKNIIVKKSLIALMTLVAFVSCVDDDDNILPEAGSIEDLNDPDAAFFFTSSSESALIKNLTNSSRRGSTEVEWTLPEGAQFWFTTSGVLTTSTDDEIVVKFPETIDDPNDPLAGYQVGIEATDANGVSSGVEFFTVPVNLIEGIPEATPSFTLADGGSNFERILTNTSVNASAGIVWSVFQDGTELDIDQLLESTNLAFLSQSSTNDEVLIDFPSAGDYEVFVTATNFNGIETTESQEITIDPLGEPIPEFTYSSNDDYTVQTLMNTTRDTSSVLWTLDGGCTLEPGFTLTDETIQVRFSSTGNFVVKLRVFTNSVDDAGDPIVLQSGVTTNETFTIPIINSRANIPEPIIIGGGFERPADEFLSEEGLARTNNDLGKEYWLPDGLSTRVLDPVTKEPFAAYPGALVENERTWFTAPDVGEFNRIGTTGSARTGDAAATWDATQGNPRAVVQYIEVVPGVDYKVSFFYSNDASSTDISLVGLILDESVVSEAGINVEGAIVAQDTYNEQGGSYVEGSLSFTVNSVDQTAVKLYFNTSTVEGDYRLDDVSIAID